ncbi:hypothetical protein IIA16_05740 [bacterium]|nr:hypothetical protein [bacterium]
MRALAPLCLLLLAAGASHAPGEILRYEATVARVQKVRGVENAVGSAVFIYDLAVLERLDGETVSVAVTCRATEEVDQNLRLLCPVSSSLVLPLRATLLPGFGPWQNLDLAVPEGLDPDEPLWGGGGELEEDGVVESWSARYRLLEHGEVSLRLHWRQDIRDSLFPRTTEVRVEAVYRLAEGRIAKMDVVIDYTLLPFQVAERLEVRLRRVGATDE